MRASTLAAAAMLCAAAAAMLCAAAAACTPPPFRVFWDIQGSLHDEDTTAWGE